MVLPADVDSEAVYLQQEDAALFGDLLESIVSHRVFQPRCVFDLAIRRI